MDRRDFVSGVDEFALASRVATAQEKEIVKTAPSADKNQKATNMLNKTRSIVECRRCELSMRLPRLRRIDSMMLGAALVSFCVVVSAQGIKGAAIATKAGNWTVYRSLDPINDKVTCTGVLKGDVKAQLSENILFIPVSGGMQSVTLRFGSRSSRHGGETCPDAGLRGSRRRLR